MIANQDTLLKSAYMNEWYWVVAMNITFNLTVYLKNGTIDPYLTMTPADPYMTYLSPALHYAPVRGSSYQIWWP